MANKRGTPANLRPPFKKGQSGNPSGRPRLHLTTKSLRTIIDRLMHMNRVELQNVVTNQNATVIELMLASVMVQAIKTGDYSRLSAILDRAVGRAGTDLGDEAVSTELTEDERRALKKLAAG